MSRVGSVGQGRQAEVEGQTGHTDENEEVFGETNENKEVCGSNTKLSHSLPGSHPGGEQKQRSEPEDSEKTIL